MIGTVNAASGLRVRRSPSASDARLITLPNGTPVEIVETQQGWHRIRMSSAGTTFDGWVSAEFVNVVLPPAPTTSVRVGLNALNRHEEVCDPAAVAGCRYFIILNNPGYASALKDRYPDAVVMVRVYWDRRMPSADEAIARMDGCRDARLIYTGLNEADECGQDYDGIQRRAAFDVEMARKIKQISGAVYAAGTFSMGTPDFTKPEICNLIRNVYAPHYNSGLLSWDHHLYSPNMQFGEAPRRIGAPGANGNGHGVTAHDGQMGKGGYTATWKHLPHESRAVNAWIAPVWFETRWQFLFTHCGFDAASPSRVYCSETGVDEGGVGGFPAHGATPADVVRWARFWQTAQAEAVNGQASPVVGGAIFQVGNREDWAGYNVEFAVGALGAEVWR